MFLPALLLRGLRFLPIFAIEGTFSAVMFGIRAAAPYGLPGLCSFARRFEGTVVHAPIQTNRHDHVQLYLETSNGYGTFS